MNPSLAIHIPEPCHEDWNKMTPKDNGSYCGSCEKTVVDFSKMNDEQIAQYVIEHPNEKMCGRFANTQLNRALRPITSIGRSGLKAFIYALVLVFGASLFAFTYSNNNGATVGELIANPIDTGKNSTPLVLDTNMVDSAEVDTTVVEPEIMTAGMMVAYIDEPVYDSVPEVNIISGKINNNSCTVGGFSVAHSYINNRIENFFPEDTSSILRKDSVSQELIDQVKLPTLESYPNPTSGAINIRYTIPKRTDVLIEIYNINGKKMMDLVSTSQLYEGTYIYPSDLSELSNGTYICRMIAGGKSFSTKILVQK